jgi:hypothetical protein
MMSVVPPVANRQSKVVIAILKGRINQGSTKRN